jgi:hypothetical protein
MFKKIIMKNIFYFGEKIKEFDIRVLNEREVRASAGVLFFLAIISFMNAWLAGNFYITKIFVVIFLIDFFIRIFINPKYSPSLIFGRFVVRNQIPEYVGAPQKRFAWGMGFALALTMFFLAVVNNVVGPINLLICLACLLLLFFETAFGICLGCKIYNFFNKEKAELCPGGSCEIVEREEIQRINFSQIAILFLFIALAISLPAFNIIKQDDLIKTEIDTIVVDKDESIIEIVDDCEVPEWAIKLGHEEQYKLHHGCEE